MANKEDPYKTDLVNRDPCNINGHVKVGFSDVLAEPEHAHSIDCLWRNSNMCYTGGKNCCYILMTTLTGLFIALCWGWTFACIAYQNIWFITPCTKVFEMYINVLRDLWNQLMDCWCGSCYRACGFCFYNIRVQTIN